MNEITITIFVEPKCFTYFLEVLNITNGLTIEMGADYVFQPSDIKYSTTMISNWLFINIPIDKYLIFQYYWRKNRGVIK